jgi:hypothetical protein
VHRHKEDRHTLRRLCGCRSVSVEGDSEAQGVKEAAFGADDIKPPAVPILDRLIQFVPELVRSLLGLRLGCLQVGDLDARIVEDLIMTFDEVEVAAHFIPFQPQMLDDAS